MKKLICVLLCLAMLTGLVTVFAGCSGISREELLKIYLPGEYIDESIFEDFEKWYEEQTGSKVKVQAKTFEVNEDIIPNVEVSKEDYDLLCPSDYMVEYLIKKNLLLEVDRSIIDVEQDGLFKPEYLENARQYDPDLKFSVPYMYGTLGLVYDITMTGKKLTSWESLFGNEFSGKRSIKDSMHDAYAAACIYNARAEIAAAALNGVDAKKAKIQEVFEDTSTATVNAAYNTLKAIKEEGSDWDIDDVKFDMASNLGEVAVALMWSCDAGHIMKTYEDEDGNKQEGNRNLWYVVPEEGGNVYIDNFLISAYAKNVKAANYFLQFLCRKDIAIRNSEYAGCISPIVEAYDELYASYDEDEDGMFEGVSADWKAMFMDAMFPSIETLNRCGIMKDFGDGQSAVVDMWNMPDIKNKVLFLEDDNIMGDYFVCEFDRNLQSLLQVSGAETIRGIVFGRFDESCKMTDDIVKEIIRDKVSPHIPIVFGVDFGHVFPMISFPIGGKVSLSANNSIDIKMIEH